MARTSFDLGQMGEEIALQALLKRGLIEVSRNWRCSAGEIDLICREGENLVFVEVKLRTGSAHGSPEEYVTVQKRTKLLSAIQSYLAEDAANEVSWRIDVVAIELAASGKVLRLAIHTNAITYESE